MFKTSTSFDFPFNHTKSGSLYSKLETGVIAVFQPNGKIKPLYFQYKDLYGDEHNIKIESIISSKDEHYAGLPAIIYSCIAVIENRRVECLLRFRITEHYWELLY